MDGMLADSADLADLGSSQAGYNLPGWLQQMPRCQRLMEMLREQTGNCTMTPVMALYNYASKVGTRTPCCGALPGSAATLIIQLQAQQPVPQLLLAA